MTTHEKAAAAILERFDFDNVERHMLATGWHWYGETTAPTADELRATARQLLALCIGKPDGHFAATGGLIVEVHGDGLSLAFEVEREIYPDPAHGDEVPNG